MSHLISLYEWYTTLYDLTSHFTLWMIHHSSWSHISFHFMNDTQLFMMSYLISLYEWYTTLNDLTSHLTLWMIHHSSWCHISFDIASHFNIHSLILTLLLHFNFISLLNNLNFYLFQCFWSFSLGACEIVGQQHESLDGTFICRITIPSSSFGQEEEEEEVIPTNVSNHRWKRLGQHLNPSLGEQHQSNFHSHHIKSNYFSCGEIQGTGADSTLQMSWW